jgi:hypothetical protein
MRKVTGDRECRRREHPGARVTLDLFREYVGDGKRRRMQMQRVSEKLHPLHTLSIDTAAPALAALGEI